MATTTAAAIAAALRDHLSARTTYLPDRKLHALLYLTQGAHFAANDKPLFDENITATEHGVRVDDVTGQQGEPLTNAHSVTVGTIASRYGGLSAMDLESLIRGQGPWSVAREAGDAPIDPDHIRQVFRSQDEVPEGTVTGFPRSHRSQPGAPRADPSAAVDDPAEIAALAAEVRARM